MVTQETMDNIDELLTSLNHAEIMNEISNETFKVWLSNWKQRFYRQLQRLEEECKND